MTAVLEGKTVVITGAGAGLGRGMALAAAEAGAHVIVTSLSENGRETTAEILERGGHATWVTCDVSNRGDVERAVAEAMRLTGRLDGIVHNAFARPRWDEPGAKSVAELPLPIWEHEVSVSLRGAYYCAQAAFPHLLATKGRLVLLTSGGGIEGSGDKPSYGACKGAIRALTKSLAREWGPLGITVNAVSPFANSPSFEEGWKRNPNAKAEQERLTAVGYLGDGEADVAPPVVFLLSDASQYVTGQTLMTDGGRYLAL
jgi:NAD(P)-dependent dehydrogenase (short-subunit alcohol dehydrogenase family)